LDQIGGYLLKDPFKKKESRKKTINGDRLMISAQNEGATKLAPLRRKERKAKTPKTKINKIPKPKINIFQ